MPLVYQQNINEVTRIGVWHIAEPEDFFLQSVSLQRSITHWHKRLQHLAGRLLLQELYPDFPVALIQVADTRKPFLANEPFHFSISHCGDYAAAIVSREYRVGVDVELDTGKAARLMQKFLDDEEMFLLPRGAISETATLFWSVKETIFKWYSLGGIDFRADMQICAVEGDREQGVVHCSFRQREPLAVHYIHFNNNYLTWVLTSV